MPAVAVAYDLARYLEPHGSSCGSWGSLVRVRLTLEPDAFAPEPLVAIEVAASHRASGLALTQRWDSRRVSAYIDLQFDTDVVGDDFALDGWCVDATAIDPAGNRVALASSCEACGAVESPGRVQPSDLEFPPVAGGPCDDGTVDTSGTTTTTEATTGPAVTSSVGETGDGEDGSWAASTTAVGTEGGPYRTTPCRPAAARATSSRRATPRSASWRPA